MVLKVEFHDDKVKQKVMQKVSGLVGMCTYCASCPLIPFILVPLLDYNERVHPYIPQKKHKRFHQNWINLVQTNLTQGLSQLQ